MEVVFALACCIGIGYWAHKRGRNPWLWGILAVFITPIFAGIILAMKKNLNTGSVLVTTQTDTPIESPSLPTPSDKTAVEEENEYVPVEEEGTENEGVQIGVDDLLKLKQMLDDGIITQEEFDKAKKKALG